MKIKKTLALIMITLMIMNVILLEPKMASANPILAGPVLYPILYKTTGLLLAGAGVHYLASHPEDVQKAAQSIWEDFKSIYPGQAKYIEDNTTYEDGKANVPILKEYWNFIKEQAAIAELGTYGFTLGAGAGVSQGLDPSQSIYFDENEIRTEISIIKNSSSSYSWANSFNMAIYWQRYNLEEKQYKGSSSNISTMRIASTSSPMGYKQDFQATSGEARWDEQLFESTNSSSLSNFIRNHETIMTMEIDKYTDEIHFFVDGEYKASLEVPAIIANTRLEGEVWNIKFISAGVNTHNWGYYITEVFTAEWVIDEDYKIDRAVRDAVNAGLIDYGNKVLEWESALNDYSTLLDKTIAEVKAENNVTTRELVDTDLPKYEEDTSVIAGLGGIATLLQRILAEVRSIPSSISNSVSQAMSQTLGIQSEVIDTGKFSMSITSTVTEKFPFSLPWDIKRAIDSVNRPSEMEFIWSNTLPLPGGGTYTLDIDLTPFESIVGWVRGIFILIFNIGLIFATRKLLGGAQ